MSNSLEDIPVNIKIKLAGIWTSVMFPYIYADYFSIYKEGNLEEIIYGEIAGFNINQTWLLSVMIFLSLILNTETNRMTNIIIGIFQILVLIAAVIGESNYYYIYATILETMLLLLIITYAWKWPAQ